MRFQKTTYLLFVSLLFVPCVATAQPDTSNFFPHTLGNLHVYNYYVSIWDPPYTVTWRDIFDSTDADSTSYVIQREQFTHLPNQHDHYYRVETVRNVYEHFWGGWGGNNGLIYKLDATQGERWRVRNTPVGEQLAIVESTLTGTLFGVSTTFKQIAYYSLPDTSDTTRLGFFLYSRIIAGGFGVVFYGGGEMFDRAYLRAGYIDGVVYGDTTTSVDELLPPFIPQDVRLLQNYPNPFNSSTMIQYDLSKEARVSLKVYSILGQEAAQLVDAYQEPGRHRVAFEAKTLASGLYVYILRAGTFTMSRRMIILK